MCYEWTDQTDPRRYCRCKFLARLPAHPATAEGGSKTNTHAHARKLTQTEITFRYLSCTRADKYASHTDTRTMFTDLSSLPGTDTQTQALAHSLPAALISRVLCPTKSNKQDMELVYTEQCNERMHLLKALKHL